MKKYKLTINEKEYNTRIVDYKANKVIVKVNGHDYEVFVKREEKAVTRIVRAKKETPNLEVLGSDSKKHAPAAPGSVVSPIPGLVLAIKVKVGDKINVGDTVIILEAMKMESEIASTAAGVVKKIHVKVQQSIQESDVIIEVE